MARGKGGLQRVAQDLMLHFDAAFCFPAARTWLSRAFLLCSSPTLVTQAFPPMATCPLPSNTKMVFLWLTIPLLLSILFLCSLSLTYSPNDWEIHVALNPSPFPYLLIMALAQAHPPALNPKDTFLVSGWNYHCRSTTVKCLHRLSLRKLQTLNSPINLTISSNSTSLK